MSGKSKSTIVCSRCGDALNHYCLNRAPQPFLCTPCTLETRTAALSLSIRTSSEGYLVMLHGGEYTDHPRIERFNPPATIEDIKNYYGPSIIWMQPMPEDDNDIIAVGI